MLQKCPKHSSPLSWYSGHNHQPPKSWLVLPANTPCTWCKVSTGSYEVFSTKKAHIMFRTHLVSRRGVPFNTTHWETTPYLYRGENFCSLFLVVGKLALPTNCHNLLYRGHTQRYATSNISLLPQTRALLRQEILQCTFCVTDWYPTQAISKLFTESHRSLCPLSW